MMAETHLKKELLERLQAKSKARGMTPNDLLESLLDEDDHKKIKWDD